MNFKKYGEAFAASIRSNPKIYLIASIILFTSMLPGLRLIKQHFSARIWLADQHPKMQALNEFEKKFGNDEFVGLGIYHPDGILRPEIIKKILKISEELWEVPDVIRVESLSNFNHIKGTEDEIEISPLIQEQNYNSIALQELKSKIDSEKILHNYFVSEDRTYTVLFGRLKPSLIKNPNFKIIIESVRDIIDRHSDFDGIKFKIMGAAAANFAFREISANDSKTIMPVMFLLMIFALYWTFKSILTVVVPCLLIIITVGITFGLQGYLGLEYSSLISAVPGVILAISIADAIHILTTFFIKMKEGMMPSDALEFSLVKNFQPTVLTSISTAIGFLSLTTTEIIPIMILGLLCAIGTLVAWLYTYTFFSPILFLCSDRFKVVSQKYKNTKISAGKSAGIVSKIDRFKLLIIITFISIASVSLYVALQNEVNSDPMEYFDNDVEVKTAYDFTRDKMKAARGVDLVIDSGSPNGAKNPEFLKSVENFEKNILDKDYVIRIDSLLYIIKKMNQNLHGDQEKYYMIPDSSRAISDILFLYTMGLPQGVNLNNQVTLDNRELRLRVTWKVEDSKASIKRTNEFIELGRKYGLKVSIGGKLPIYMSMNSMVVNTFFKSMTMALFFVSIMMLVVFRNLKLALLSMLPNVVPLIFGGALMTILGMNIDIGTAIVCSVCLGIAVDDTIHFIANYKLYQNSGMSPKDSMIDTFKMTGKALLMTTITLVLGFGCFSFGDFVPNRNFGILCMVTLTAALITDLLFLPAVLLFTDRKQS